MAGSSCELRLNGPLGAVVVTTLSTAVDAHGTAVLAAAQHASRANFSTDERFEASSGRIAFIGPSWDRAGCDLVRHEFAMDANGVRRRLCVTLRADRRPVKKFVCQSCSIDERRDQRTTHMRTRVENTRTDLPTSIAECVGNKSKAAASDWAAAERPIGPDDAAHSSWR
jgi:hypothetical protein